MDIDGFWTVHFSGTEILGSGVVIFSKGKLFGGETGFYYIGTYTSEGNVLKARVMIRNFDPSTPSGFGIPGDYEMSISVMLQDERTMTGTAMIANQPQHNLGIRLIKRANI